MDIISLKRELGSNDIYEIVNKYILCEDCVCFSGEKDLIRRLKTAIADHFHLHLKNIEIVGSGKLGISLNEERFGKPFDSQSDIDLIVVSSELFDRAWIELLMLDYKYPHRLRGNDRDFLRESFETIHKGYLSPNKLPEASNFGKNWWAIFNGLSNKAKYENRKIRGRLFKNWFCVEKYYSLQLIKLKGE